MYVSSINAVTSYEQPFSGKCELANGTTAKRRSQCILCRRLLAVFHVVSLRYPLYSLYTLAQATTLASRHFSISLKKTIDIYVEYATASGGSLFLSSTIFLVLLFSFSRHVFILFPFALNFDIEDKFVLDQDELFFNWKVSKKIVYLSFVVIRLYFRCTRQILLCKSSLHLGDFPQTGRYLRYKS